MIGARIRATRKAAGLSLLELASVVGVSHAQIAYYETGQAAIRVSTLRRIAAALGVHPGALIEEDALTLPIGLIDEQRAAALIVKRLARIRDPKVLRWVMSIIDVVGETLMRA